ncbi:uncharacterized protein LOC115035198 [Echeneis naucrates]|uniref:uncharacterized protein LOC115035198 n=1 Tax=Echeneis naucrates TaxID=173247 RepID=UPI00111436C9|nr:uncharacterized protein LOC115035198 [Echeneis naucrates]
MPELASGKGLLAACHHLKEHQVPLSGRLRTAKHRGMERVQNSFSPTRRYRCTYMDAPRSARSPSSRLLAEIAEGTRKPQLNTCSHGALTTPGCEKSTSRYHIQGPCQDQATASQEQGGRRSRDGSSKGLRGQIRSAPSPCSLCSSVKRNFRLPSLCFSFRGKTSTEAAPCKRCKNGRNSKKGNVVVLQHNRNHVCGFMKLDSP